MCVWGGGGGGGYWQGCVDWNIKKEEKEKKRTAKGHEEWRGKKERERNWKEEKKMIENKKIPQEGFEPPTIGQLVLHSHMENAM